MFYRKADNAPLGTWRSFPAMFTPRLSKTGAKVTVATRMKLKTEGESHEHEDR